MIYPIFNEIEQIKIEYDKAIPIMDGLNFSQKERIRMIEFYTNSKYLNGQKDELTRDKPFKQISNAVVDTENAAKDIDTKDITITSDDPNHYTESMLMSKDIYQWMKTANFAKTLNKMIDTDSRYGSLLVKKVMVERDGKEDIDIQIPEWKNVITDQVDIINSPIIEVHYMTASQMMRKEGWHKEKVQEAVRLLGKEKSTKRIPIFEVRGDFPKYYIDMMDGGTEDSADLTSTDFSYQLYYIAGAADSFEKGVTSISFTDKLIPLYWEDDTERVYKYKARKERSGRAFGVGVVEEGEEAQVWTNDAVLKQARAMEYTTKVIGQSASKKLKGRNMLTETDDGQILEHEDGKPITALNLLPSGGLQQYIELQNQWYEQFEKTTAAYSAQRGDTPPSGTPFRLQATVLQQSSSVFQKLQEDMGIFINEIFTDWILPFKAKQLNQEHILAHEFSPNELRDIDKNFATHAANQKAVELILDGKIVDADQYQMFMDGADTFIKGTKEKRFIKIPKDYYKNMTAKISINITGEQKNKAAILESLTSILTTYASNPTIASDPVANEIFMRLVELSGAGISPVTLSSAMQQSAKNAQAMAQQPQEGAQPSPMSLSANPTPQI
jgi:hypothetical protein